MTHTNTQNQAHTRIGAQIPCLWLEKLRQKEETHIDSGHNFFSRLPALGKFAFCNEWSQERELQGTSQDPRKLTAFWGQSGGGAAGLLGLVAGGTVGVAEFYIQNNKGTSWALLVRYANIHWGSKSRGDPEFEDNPGNLLYLVCAHEDSVHFGTGVEELIGRPVWQ